MELKVLFAQDLQGNVIPSPTVYIYTAGTTSVISGLEDKDGEELANPFTGTAQGLIQVAAPTGIYDMRVTGGGRDFTRRVQFIDLADQIAEAEGLVTDATNQANAAAASAASAAIIADIASVQFFTNPLTKAIRAAITAATSASNGIQQLSNTQNNFGTGSFAFQYKDAQPDWTPAADVVLSSKHDGTNGYILTLLTTGKLRTTINGTNFDSTSATGLTDGDVGVIDVDIIPATATAAGSVTYTLNGVQLGTALAISARVEKITNGTFDTDITGWTLAPNSTGTATWVSGKMRVERTGGSTTRAYQAISMAAGETLYVRAAATWVSGASAQASMSIRNGADSLSSTALATSNASAAGGSASLVLSYYSATAQTVYLHCSTISAVGAYDFDTITSIDSATVDNTANLYVCGTSTTRSATEWYGHRLFNRAKTVAENLMMQKKGVLPADVGASNTELTQNGDFELWDSSTTLTNWGEGSSVAGSISQVTGADAYAGTYSLQFSGAGLPSATIDNTIYSTEFADSDLGRRVRITIAARRISGTGSLYVGQGDDQYSTINTAAGLDGTWKVFTFEKVLTRVSSSSTRRAVLAGASGSTFQVDAYSIKFIGCTSELLAENAQSNTGQVLDTSGNKQHALLPAAGAAITGRPVSQPRQVRGTNEWTASTSTQYVVGTNQNHIPAQAAWTVLDIIASGSVTVHIGDGSDVDRYGASIALSAGKNRVTLITPFNDGTNLKLTLTPTSSFTGTLETTAAFIVLED